MNQFYLLLLLSFVIISCETTIDKSNNDDLIYNVDDEPYLVVLGVAQDAGFPQAGCNKSCCLSAHKNSSLRKLVTSIALIDPKTGKRWLFEASPDFKEQLARLDSLTPPSFNYPYDGIFLSHAHIGHYTGLMNLGREAMATNKSVVYAMPRMANFITQNGPWSQLVSLQNIVINIMSENAKIELTDNISITPFIVPHRDEFSETVGFKIQGPQKEIIFIPDIDKWGKWQEDIKMIVRNNDLLLLDGTFFHSGELPGRDMRLIPHPFVVESLKLFSDLPFEEKAKIHFIHFNHTNPLLLPSSQEAKKVKAAGFNLADEFQKFTL